MTIPVYVIYVWAVMKKLPVDIIESGVRENLTKILSGEYRNSQKFFKSLWEITGSPFVAGIQGVMYYRMGNYKAAHKWFETSHMMNTLMEKKKNKNRKEDEETDARDGLEGLENPIEDIVFPSVHADALFRMGNFVKAEQLWSENEIPLKKGFVFLQAGEEDRGKILSGDEDAVENVYLSLPEDNTNQHTSSSGTELADAVLWWEGVSLSPYIFADESGEEETLHNWIEEDADEEYIFDNEGNLRPAKEIGADVVLENYTRLTISLLRRLYSNTLFGLGFVKYVQKREEEAEENWGTGVRHLGDRSCRRALQMTEKYITVEEAFQQSLKANTNNENTETGDSTNQTNIVNNDSTLPVPWLKNFTPNVASLYLYLTQTSET